MDLSQYLPAELTQSNGRHHLEEERKLKDKINTHAKEIQNLGNQLFGKMLYRRKLENSIRNQKAILSQLSQNISTKTQHQNKLAKLVNLEQEKRKVLEEKANDALQRIKENTEKINENRRRVDHFGEHVFQCNDSMQNISSEISDIQEDMRQFREQEGKLIQLNVELANAEMEYSELSNSLKITEMNLAKLDVRNGKEIEYLTAKKQEVEGNLMKNLTEKNKLQRELDGCFYENRVTEKLDEIQVVFENHSRSMAQVQTEHEEAMKALEQQLKDTIDQNEAFQKALTDLDVTINQQLDALDMAKEELGLISSKRYNDVSELKPLLLDLEEKKCQISQLEEEIMYMQNELGEGDHNESVSQRPPTSIVSQSVIGRNTLTERATSTPHLTLNESKNGNLSFPSTALSQSNINSSRSMASPALTGTKRSSKQLDGEISSTQN